MTAQNGIYCLEGLWEEKTTTRMTVLPMLDLLWKCEYIKDYRHRDCATRNELEYYLEEEYSANKTKKVFDDYTILYLGFHGSESG